VFVSDEISTPNATEYNKLTFAFDQNSYGMVQFQTRSGKSNNATDGSWEAWKPSVSNTNIKTLNAMDATGDWTATNLSSPADGVLARNIDEFEDEDITNAANKSVKFGSVGSPNGYAEDTISSTDLTNFDLISAWVYATNSGNLVKLGFGESAATEQEETFSIDTANTWQKIYWDITDVDESLKNAVTKLRVSVLSTNTTVYVDSLQAERLMNNNSGHTIASTPNDYLQYRAILTTTNSSFQPKLFNVTAEWNNGFKIVQTDANTVRLYNYSGETQQIRLDAITFGADLAEWYTVEDETVEEGDLVAVTGKIDEYDVPILRKTAEKNDAQIVGGISTKAGKTLGLEAPNRRLLALAGRIPVKIASNSASISAGDLITSSSEPGRGRKANPGDLIMGRALENWTPNLGKDRILVLVQSVSPAPDADVSDGGAFTILTDTWNVINQNTQEALTRLGTYAEIVSGKISTGYLESYNLVTRTLSVASSLISPAAHIDQISTDHITPIASDSAGIAISLNDRQTLTITDAMGTPSATFDNLGNAAFTGEVRAESIITSEASVSGTLYADRITTNFGDLNDRFAAVESTLTEISNQAGAAILPPPIIVQSTESALLSAAVTATEDALIVNTDLFVLKHTALSDTSITGVLVIDNMIRMANNVLETIGDTLYIQKNKLAGVDILDGTVWIDTFNHIFLRGDVAISGNTTIGGVLGVNAITPGNTGNLTVDLANPIPDITATSPGIPATSFGDLIIRGLDQKVVTRITASGSAQFAGDITIEGATKLNGPIQLTTNSLGTSISIAEGATTLTTSGLSLPNTLYSVFVTPSWNTSAWVSMKTPTTFTIHFATPAPAGATADWLILLGNPPTGTIASPSATQQ